MKIRLSHPTGHISGRISLGGSKSISNRAQIIRALTNNPFSIGHLSQSDDSMVLAQILASTATIHDVHHAGTAFRFLTSYLATIDGEQILTGSARMLQRPVGPLVDALNALGANITYMGEEGFPPLSISNPPTNWGDRVTIDGGISSQFISSLLLIAPVLPNGLTIQIAGELVSKPYIELTVAMMTHFGAKVVYKDDVIEVAPVPYQERAFYVEADWSSASYYFSLAALSKSCDLQLEGLHRESLQADSAIVDIATSFGVKCEWEGDLLRITKGEMIVPFYEYNFINCPDIAQTVFVMAAAKGTKCLFSGLKTLRIKETDRIAASNVELGKFGSFLSLVPTRFKKNTSEELYMLEGTFEIDTLVAVDTYQDHRMALAFAPIALTQDLIINDAQVVTKSYPKFWCDLEVLGFIIERLTD